MFLRITKARSRKTGKMHVYAALAKSKRVRGKKHPQTEIIHNLGRMDDKTVDILRRLQSSIDKAINSYEKVREET